MGDRDLSALGDKVARLWPHLDERARRPFAASEARELGHGGILAVSGVCGLSRVTITKGLRELDEPPLAPGRVRRPGAGRPRIEVSDPELVDQLDALVEPLSRGDPESPLRWTSKGTRVLAGELTAAGHPVSHETVAQLLRALDYSLQGTRKTEEGKQHLLSTDRNCLVSNCAPIDHAMGMWNIASFKACEPRARCVRPRVHSKTVGE